MPDIIVRVEQIFMGPAVSAVPIQRGWLRFTDVRRHTPPVERDCRRNPSARKHAATAVCQTDTSRQMPVRLHIRLIVRTMRRTRYATVGLI